VSWKDVLRAAAKLVTETGLWRKVETKVKDWWHRLLGQ
jgi:hypothetical protein